MSKFVSFLGKLIFFGVFIGVGITLINNVDSTAKSAEKGYDKFHKAWRQINSTTFAPPQAIRPGAFRLHSKSLIKYTGFALIGSSVLSLLGVSYVSGVISLFLLATAGIFHNPLFSEDGYDFNNRLTHCFLTLALLGGSLIFFNQKSKPSEPAKKTESPKKEEISKETNEHKEKRGDHHKKNENNSKNKKKHD